MTHRAIAIAVSAIAMALSPAVQAQAVKSAEVYSQGGSIEIPINKSQVVTADRPIARAMIGNDEIADIFPISDRSVYVLGKELGTTSLTLYGSGNQVLAVMDISVGPDVLALREQIGALMPDENIDARISNQSIVLSGMAKSAGSADRVVQLARAYAGDDVVNLMTLGSSQQVMLEVRFAEVSRNIGEQLGVGGFTSSNGGAFSSATGTGSGFVPNPDTGFGQLERSAVTGSFGVFRRIFSDVAGLRIDAVLDTLEQRGLSKTLAEPTLVSLSGQRASFLAGGEFPIPVVQNGGGGAATGGASSISVEFKSFGVSLGFTPTVLGDSTINLLVEPEVSAIDPTASITLNGIQIPGLQTRRASTVIELRDGESFAIAGLIQEDFKTTVEQIPLLGSIPIIGTLFRSTSFQKGETELLIVVTPRLVQPIRPDQVRLPTDRVKDPNALETILTGEAYRPVELPPAEPRADQAENTGESEGDDYDY
ncbi:type II and III secretion system protein family protein [Pontixanthobacter luteolus]|uniref:type II and III secretion system protein family protein n=1 Tax=Pontixanthobacter luteolus TaxID=295089 RepID=UPI00230343AB|nr:type II and III secretion system protein family protein [Pontixanthobacter luteolus]